MVQKSGLPADMEHVFSSFHRVLWNIPGGTKFPSINSSVQISKLQTLFRGIKKALPETGPIKSNIFILCSQNYFCHLKRERFFLQFPHLRVHTFCINFVTCSHNGSWFTERSRAMFCLSKKALRVTGNQGNAENEGSGWKSRI